jgi:hypothetical protein
MVAARTVWPRVDKDPRCTARLGMAIRTMLGGPSLNP